MEHISMSGKNQSLLLDFPLNTNDKDNSDDNASEYYSCSNIRCAHVECGSGMRIVGVTS